MEDNIKRIKEKTIPALCNFVEKTCNETTSETELEILPEVVKGLYMLTKNIKHKGIKETAHSKMNEQSKKVFDDGSCYRK